MLAASGGHARACRQRYAGGCSRRPLALATVGGCRNRGLVSPVAPGGVTGAAIRPSHHLHGACDPAWDELLRWACHGWEGSAAGGAGPSGSSAAASASGKGAAHATASAGSGGRPEGGGAGLSAAATTNSAADAAAAATGDSESHATSTTAAGSCGRPEGGGGAPLRVAVRDLGPGRGRALVAMADVTPGETLLSVPMDRVFASWPNSPLYWAADMAVRLLLARHRSAAMAAAGAAAAGGQTAAPRQDCLHPRGDEAAADAASSGASGFTGVTREDPDPDPAEADAAAAGKEDAGASRQGSGSGTGLDWGPWIRSLPGAVRTPLEYDEEEVRQLGCPYAVEEVLGLQRCLRDNYEAVQPELEAIGCGWEDFLWAVQVFHSRCFIDPGSGRHLCVPGVDMANHSHAPNAAVRILNSPDACQGYEALEEVAPPRPREPSRFALQAGEDGIRCGEEATISYGRWPSEAFLLLFGFVPAAAEGGGGCIPGESLTLFAGAEEAVRWCLQAATAPQQGDALEGLVEDALRAVEKALNDEDMDNLHVTAKGIDGRLQVILGVISSMPGLNFQPKEVLVRRIRERLSHYGLECTGEAGVKAFLESKRALARIVLRALGA